MKTFIITGFIVLVLAIVFVGLQLVIGLEHTYFIFSSFGALLTLGAIAVAIFMPKRIAKRQNELAKQQNELAKQQNEISNQQNEFAKQQNEIAKQQNKIALFEKRYETYSIYGVSAFSINMSYKGVKQSSGKLDKFTLGKLFIQNLIPEKYKRNLISSNDETLDTIVSLLHQVNTYIYELNKIVYLFSLDKQGTDILQKIISELVRLPYDIHDDDIKFDVFQTKLIELSDWIMDQYILTTMQQQLQLSSEVK